MDLVQTHRCLLLMIGPHFSKVVLTFNYVLHGLRFNLRYKSKVKNVRRGGKSAIWPYWFCWQSIIVLTTPPSSMSIKHHSTVPCLLTNNRLLKNEGVLFIYSENLNWLPKNNLI